MGIETNKYLLKSGVKAEDAAFENREAMVEAMQSPLYKDSAEYRELVQHCLRKPFSDDTARITAAQEALDKKGVPKGRQLEYAMSDPEGAKQLEADAIFREQSQAMFLDPRYQTSPTYRKQVADYIRANDTAITAAMPKGALIDRTAQKAHTKVRVELGNGSAQAIRDEQAAYKRLADKKSLADRHAALDADPDASLDHYDLGGQRV